MSKYQKYGERLDNLARERFSEYEKARDAYTKAKKAHFDNPVRTGFGVTLDDQLKARQYEIEFLKAEENFKEAQKVYRSTEKEIEKIREELYNELKEDMTVRPEDLDRNVVTLLESGICKAQDIQDLYNKAQNTTTKRYIANFAKGQITDRMDRDTRLTLESVVQNAPGLENPDLTETMQIFDSVSHVLQRCINNDALISYWGQFTEEPISEM